jgi:hypothetical protein
MGTSTPTPIPYEDPGQHPTRAMLGYTTSLQRGEIPASWDGLLESIDDWGDIGEVRDLTPLDMSRDTVEVTNHRSPGFAVETIPALITPGSASFEMNFVPELFADPDTAQGQLFADFQRSGNAPWRVVFPTAESIRFLASLTSYSITAPVSDVMQGSFELAISGEIQWCDAQGDLVEFAALASPMAGHAPIAGGANGGSRPRSSRRSRPPEAITPPAASDES